jgi:hypothetical protein
VQSSESRSAMALNIFVSLAFGSSSMPSIRPRMYDARSELLMIFLLLITFKASGGEGLCPLHPHSYAKHNYSTS